MWCIVEVCFVVVQQFLPFHISARKARVQRSFETHLGRCKQQLSNTAGQDSHQEPFAHLNLEVNSDPRTVVADDIAHVICLTTIVLWEFVFENDRHQPKSCIESFCSCASGPQE
eukprot:268411-Amphidinium_carterae.1